MTAATQPRIVPATRVSCWLAGLLFVAACGPVPARGDEPLSADELSVELSGSDPRGAGGGAGAARPITPPRSRDGRGKISQRTAPDSAWWTTLGGLGTVLALLGGAAWVVRKNLPAVPRGLPKSVVEVLGKRSLEPRSALHLVRCGSRILVIGTTPQGMVPLAEITDAAEVDFLAGLCRTEEESAQNSFLDLVAKFRRGDDPRVTESDPEPGDDEPARARASAADEIPRAAGPRAAIPDPAATRLKRLLAADRRRDPPHSPGREGADEPGSEVSRA